MTVWVNSPEESGNLADVGDWAYFSDHDHTVIDASQHIPGHLYSVKQIGQASSYDYLRSGRTILIPSAGSTNDIYTEFYYRQSGASTTASWVNIATLEGMQISLRWASGSPALFTFGAPTSGSLPAGTTFTRHASTTIAVDTWYKLAWEAHLAGGVKTGKLYVNDVYELEISGASESTPFTGLSIGQWMDPYNDSPQPYWFDAIYMASVARATARAAFKLAVA